MGTGHYTSKSGRTMAESPSGLHCTRTKARASTRLVFQQIIWKDLMVFWFSINTAYDCNWKQRNKTNMYLILKKLIIYSVETKYNVLYKVGICFHTIQNPNIVFFRDIKVNMLAYDLVSCIFVINHIWIVLNKKFKKIKKVSSRKC